MGTYMGCDKVHIQLNNHEIYYTKEQLQEAINDADKCIDRIKQELFGLICGNPKDLLVTKDCEEAPIAPVEAAQCRFEQLMGESDNYAGLEYYLWHKFKLELLLEHWEDRWNEADGYGLTETE